MRGSSEETGVTKLDGGQAWTEAMAMLRGQRELLLTVAGALILLPTLIISTVYPVEPPADPTLEAQLAVLRAWFAEHWFATLVGALVGALGRLTILILLIAPGRPTVGEALSAGVRLLALFFLTGLLANLVVLGGALLFVIPGLYLIGRTLLAETALVAERLGNPVAPIGRAFALSRGNGWRIFATFAIIYVAGWLLSTVIILVLGVLGALFGDTSVVAFLTALVGGLFQAGVSLVLVLISVAFYRQATGASR